MPALMVFSTNKQCHTRATRVNNWFADSLHWSFICLDIFVTPKYKTIREYNNSLSRNDSQRDSYVVVSAITALGDKSHALDVPSCIEDIQLDTQFH